MVIEHVRVSQQAKDRLIRLKRFTGIQNWNVLCRWAFCISLAEESVPTLSSFPLDSNVEMTWKVFGGRYADLYTALLKKRCLLDGLGTDHSVLAEQCRLHMHRGIAYLAGNTNLRSIEHLISLAIESSD